MKRYLAFYIIVATIVHVVSVGHAALISTYSFDETTKNGVAGAPNGTLVNSPVYVDGVVGSKAIEFKGNDYMKINSSGLPLGGEAFGNNAGGLWVGSVSMWVRSAVIQESTIAKCRGGRGKDDSTWLIGMGHDYSRKSNRNCCHMLIRDQLDTQFKGSGNAPDWSNNKWHHLVWAWNTTDGNPNTGTMTFYMDSVVQTVSGFSSTVTSGSLFPKSWRMATIGCGHDPTGCPNEFYVGSLDDFSVWNEVLTTGRASALYNLAKSSLNYNAKDAAVLFEIADSGVAAKTSDERTWRKVTGLKGAPGSVTQSSGNWIVQFDKGDGVTTAAKLAGVQ